jgi:hypothetical protein
VILDDLIEQFADSLEQLIDVQKGTELATDSVQSLKRSGIQFRGLFCLPEFFLAFLTLRYVTQEGAEKFPGRTSERPADRNLDRKLVAITMSR